MGTIKERHGMDLTEAEYIKKRLKEYFGHLMRRTDSFEKTLILGNIEGRRRKG